MLICCIFVHCFLRIFQKKEVKTELNKKTVFYNFKYYCFKMEAINL